MIFPEVCSVMYKYTHDGEWLNWTYTKISVEEAEWLSNRLVSQYPCMFVAVLVDGFGKDWLFLKGMALHECCGRHYV